MEEYVDTVLSSSLLLSDKKHQELLASTSFKNEEKSVAKYFWYTRNDNNTSSSLLLRQKTALLKHLLEADDAFDFSIIGKAFVSMEKNLCSSTPASSQVAALKLSCAFIRAYPPQGSTKWSLNFVRAQASLFQSLMSNDVVRYKLKSVARVAFKKAVVSSSSLYQTVALDASTPFYPDFISAVASATVINELNDDWVALYTHHGFESKTRKSLMELSCFNKVIENITPELYEAKVRQSIVKNLKKSPDSFLKTMLHFFSTSTVIEMHAEDVENVICPMLKSKLKSQAENIRTDCVALCATLTRRSSVAASRISKTLVEMYEGKHEMLSLFYQRQAVLQALSATEKVESTKFLMTAALKESHEETRVLIFKVLGKFFAKSLEKDELNFISTCLDEKKQLSGILHTIKLVLDSNPEYISKETWLLTSLEAASTDNEYSVIVKALALELVMILATRDATTTTSNVTKLFNDPTSFVYTSNFDDEEVASAICHSLVIALRLNVDFNTAMTDTLVLLVLHDVRSIRSMAVAQVKQLVRYNPEVSLSLLTSYYNTLQISDKICHKYVEALYSILPESGVADKKLLPKLFILSHHPLINNKKTTWRLLRSRIGLTNDDEDFIEDDDELIKDITTELVAFTEKSRLFPLETYGNAIATLLQHGGAAGEDVAFDIITTTLASQLECNLKDTSAYDVAVYNTPSGKIFEEKKSGVADKQYDSRKKSNNLSTEEWEEQVRRETKAKSNTGEVKLTKEQKQLLSAQEQVRQAVALKVDATAKVLEVVSILARRCSSGDEMTRAIPYLLPALMSLMSSAKDLPISATVFTTVCTILEKNTTEMVSSVATDVAIAIRYIAIKKDAVVVFPAGVFANVVQSVAPRVVDNDEILSPPNFTPIFIVISYLLQNYTLNNAEAALQILSAHCEMISEEEEMDVGDIAAQKLLRRDMIYTLLKVLATSHGMSVSVATDALQVLCTTGDIRLSVSEFNMFFGSEGLLSPSRDVRSAVLKTINAIIIANTDATVLRNPVLVSRLWFCKHDAEKERVADVADKCWEHGKFELSSGYASPLMLLVAHTEAYVRRTASVALAAGMKLFPNTSASVISSLLNLYQQKLAILCNNNNNNGTDSQKNSPQFFERGGPAIEFEAAATLAPRSGVAHCLNVLATSKCLSADDDSALVALKFITDEGLVDPSSAVRRDMMTAGASLVASYGQNHIDSLFATFESRLSATQISSSDDVLASDHQREGIVVFYGTLCQYSSDISVIKSVVDTLCDSLQIQSESVQKAVATCLIPLVKKLKEDLSATEDLFRKILNLALVGSRFGDRLGGAIGVAALVKATGISSLKKFDVINTLTSILEDKKSAFEKRQGALFIFECLSDRLGFLIEPYVPVILPLLLKAFADSSVDVREAAASTAAKLMSSLSSHGTKIVFPLLVSAIHDRAWRTKHAAIKMLGATANLNPRQLAASLPTIVPLLTEALGDSKSNVREAAKAALSDIGNVVRNPEVASISSTLLSALGDPSRYTSDALVALSTVNFVHSIDAPSLALIIPILQRGLKSTTGELKKSAALIVGNISSMCHSELDILPYLPHILPLLQTLLMDEIPEVRTVTSKAMGLLVTGVGESHFPDVVPWLIDSTVADSSTVERSGSAQGLCEVLVALGMERLDETLRALLPLQSHPSSHVREGVLWTLAFLCPALGKHKFASYLTATLPIIISGLSDESEAVRDVSMHAGHVIVNRHAISHTSLILPTLEAGIYDYKWRVRNASISLLGDLLYNIGGTKKVGLAENDDDEGAGNAATDVAITTALGQEKRNEIYAALYMIRSDTTACVRQGALQVWKSVVSNTPRTLRQILPSLMKMLITSLASDVVERRVVAGKALGEIVIKLGERAMGEILEILNATLADKTGSLNHRTGACLGLAQVVAVAPKKLVEEYVEQFISGIQTALVDAEDSVASSAAAVFVALKKSVGGIAVDAIIPLLLKTIESDDADASERALKGLQEILSSGAKGILPYVVPKLLATPLTVAHMEALASISRATGNCIHYHLDAILSTVSSSLKNDDEDYDEQVKAALATIVSSISTPAGTQWLSLEISKYVDAESSRNFGLWLLGSYCRNTSQDYSEYVPVFLKNIVAGFLETDSVALDALAGLSATTSAEALSQHLEYFRTLISSVVSDARHRKTTVKFNFLPVLQKKKALDPFLPFYQHALMYGMNPVIRDSAATGLGELVTLTPDDVLKPYLIKITGPLIRIVGDKFPGHVKASILKTLEICLVRGGVALKPFMPQLQTTFVKAIVNDPVISVRRAAVAAIGALVAINVASSPSFSRLEILVNDLVEKARKNLFDGDKFITISILEGIKTILTQLMTNAEKLSATNIAENVSKFMNSEILSQESVSDNIQKPASEILKML